MADTDNNDYSCGIGITTPNHTMELSLGDQKISVTAVEAVSPFIKYHNDSALSPANTLQPVDPATGAGDYIAGFKLDGGRYVPYDKSEVRIDHAGHKFYIERETGLPITGNTNTITLDVYRFDAQNGRYSRRDVSVTMQDFVYNGTQVQPDKEQRSCPRYSFNTHTPADSGQLSPPTRLALTKTSQTTTIT